MISGETPDKREHDITAVAGGELREWQKPLTPEKIAWLQKQYVYYKKLIDEVWGKPQRPWIRNRRGW